ncbi:MAG: hypothetical protein OXF33_02120 [Rhodospirillales bacterium]|nr:hypothetical protein [Rhodospirillales bacterium]
MDTTILGFHTGTPPRPTGGLARTVQTLDWLFRQLDVAIRWNERIAAPEFKRGEREWQRLNRRQEDAWREEIGASYRDTQNRALLFGREAWTRCLNALLADRQEDPVLAWLDLNFRDKWDGTPRLDGLLSNIFTVDPENPFAAWAGRYPFLGAAFRTMFPGAKLDEFPTLVGPEGCGKSTFCAWALPEELRGELFTDGLDLAGRAKDRADTILGKMIVEVSELVGLNRSEIESVKAFISRVDDGNVRLSYEARAEPLPRRCVFIGTSNRQTDLLPADPAGNRRFVIVPVKPHPHGVAQVREYLEENREQLWSEAWTRVLRNEHPRLPDHLKSAQADANKQYRVRDDLLEDRVEQWLAGKDYDAFTTATAAVGCGLIRNEGDAASIRVDDARRLGAALRLAGFEKRRERIGQARVFVWGRR